MGPSSDNCMYPFYLGNEISRKPSEWRHKVYRDVKILRRKLGYASNGDLIPFYQVGWNEKLFFVSEIELKKK
jgi:hypothetical protein